jgi:hypothetical protein
VLTRFELYNEKNERVCICKFTENYSKSASINGYFSRPIFRNYHNEIFGTMKYLGTSWLKTCKNISIDGITDKDVMVDNTQDIEKWWQDERKKITPLDPSYFASTGVKCYYCDDFEIDSLSKGGKRNYESHVKSKHGDDLDHPCYPTKSDLERLGLKTQDKDWEI